MSTHFEEQNSASHVNKVNDVIGVQLDKWRNISTFHYFQVIGQPQMYRQRVLAENKPQNGWCSGMNN